MECHRSWPVTFILLVILRMTNQTSLRSDLFYNAGVVEFRPSSELTADARLKDNLNSYLEIIGSDQAKLLDIIVFPESTLNSNEEATFVPDPANSTIPPCHASPNEYHNLLVQLSCAARNNSMYVVINLTEKEKCSVEDERACASSGLNLFNTNVVFDRRGLVISRYRKVNLYGEDKNSTLKPEFGWFDTDFGVRFGHFICFDILFYTPAQELVEKYGIKDVLFPTMWFSQMPFLTAVQFHQAWSYGNNVNFLAAGASLPAIGSTGSGIYNGRNGIIIATMQQEKGERALYTAQVPKYKEMKYGNTELNSSPLAKEISNHNLRLKIDHLQSYTSILLDMYNRSTFTQELCFSNSSFCCHFDLKWQNISQTTKMHYLYRLGVFEGQRYEEGLDSNQLKNCAIFSCSGPHIMDCGKLADIKVDVIFERITISAKFPKTKRFLHMPSSVMHDTLMPIDVKNFEWTESQEKNQSEIAIRYSLRHRTSNILAFAIYANYFDSVVKAHASGDGKDGAASEL